MSVCNEKSSIIYMLNNLKILKKSIKPYIPFKNNPIRQCKDPFYDNRQEKLNFHN